MADEKSKNLTGADGPDKDPAQPEAGGSPAPGKAQKAPEAAKGTKEAAPKQKEEKGTEPPGADGQAPQPKSPVQAGPAQPQEAPRRGDEQIVYLKLSELHAFKDHPFQVRNDEEMKAMVSSVKDKGVTQPAIVRPREDGGYEIVSATDARRSASCGGHKCVLFPHGSYLPFLCIW